MKLLNNIELLNLIRTSPDEQELAFKEVYDRYSQKVYLYCRKILSDTDAADDIFQEVFLSFLNYAKEQNDIVNLIGFLLKIARNLCLNYKRDNEKYNLSSIDDFQIQGDSVTYESEELERLVTTSLELLIAEHKEAFILQVYEGLSYKEISELTEVPVSTVRNRVVRAKKKLREILNPYLDYQRQEK